MICRPPCSVQNWADRVWPEICTASARAATSAVSCRRNGACGILRRGPHRWLRPHHCYRGRCPGCRAVRDGDFGGHGICSVRRRVCKYLRQCSTGMRMDGGGAGPVGSAQLHDRPGRRHDSHHRCAKPESKHAVRAGRHQQPAAQSDARSAALPFRIRATLGAGRPERSSNHDSRENVRRMPMAGIDAGVVGAGTGQCANRPWIRHGRSRFKQC
jgi:hypothetical protein